MNELRLLAKLYIALMVLAALAVAGFMVAWSRPPDAFHLILALVFVALIMLALSFPLQFVLKTKWTLHTSVLFAAVLLFPPATAVLVAGAGVLLDHLRRRQPWDQTLFNTAILVLQTAAAGWLLLQAGWTFDTGLLNRPVFVGLVAVAGVVMYLIEVTGVAIIVALQMAQPLLLVWREHASSQRIETLAQVGVGLLGAIIADTHTWALTLVILPAIALYRSAQHRTLPEKGGLHAETARVA